MKPTVIRLACGHTLTLSADLVDTLSLRDLREGVAVIRRGHYAAEHPPLLERARATADVAAYVPAPANVTTELAGSV